MSEKKIPLVECFGPTIQGEGAVIGQQTYFMRFGLCDYKCGMCDSMHAVDPLQVKENAQWLTQEEIANQFVHTVWKPNSTKWISLSGGNPCIHDLSLLVNVLKKCDFKFAVETQGTKAPAWLSLCDIITVSPKGPGMKENFEVKEMDTFMTYVMSANPIAVNIKVVIFDQRDLEFAKMIWERYAHSCVPFYLSLGNPHPPGQDQKVSVYDLYSRLTSDYRSIFDEIKTDSILSQMCFLPQWHVFVWGNDKGK
jgi:7-carboxy-7-deazaguanine synthase